MWHRGAGSPFQEALRGPGDLEITKYLVEELGVDPNPAGSIHRTVLGQAYISGTPGALRYVLDQGADMAAVDRVGNPAVFNIGRRTSGKDIEILEEVLSRGLRISEDMRDYQGRNILHVAVLGGSKELLERLVGECPGLLQGRDNDGWTALHWVARRRYRSSDENDTEIVRWLLERGCPGIDEAVAVGENEWVPGELAAYHGAPESVLEAFRRGGWNEGDGQIQAADLHESWNCDCCLAVRYPMPMHQLTDLLTLFE
ncbi:hypothetical protein NUW58_g3747 [Xylaria curta]|uniref:Uncharacterized protein n=2 Tax=Xylaria curta TaxID=42375 RepID=A0ACC1P2H1_9PEZI|nr:hypothetical protein NUW58_g5518 [Xylaria curta]KAJ2988889.1 hypothetical protein NUW58_g3747 [Xylaria curta]